MLKTQCAECARVYSVPDQFAGRKMKCKACGGSVQVPELDAEPAAAPAPAPAEATAPRKKIGKPIAAKSASAKSAGKKIGKIGGAKVGAAKVGSKIGGAKLGSKIGAAASKRAAASASEGGGASRLPWIAGAAVVVALVAVVFLVNPFDIFGPGPGTNGGDGGDREVASGGNTEQGGAAKGGAQEDDSGAPDDADEPGDEIADAADAADAGDAGDAALATENDDAEGDEGFGDAGSELAVAGDPYADLPAEPVDPWSVLPAKASAIASLDMAKATEIAKLLVPPEGVDETMTILALNAFGVSGSKPTRAHAALVLPESPLELQALFEPSADADSDDTGPVPDAVKDNIVVIVEGDFTQRLQDPDILGMHPRGERLDESADQGFLTKAQFVRGGQAQVAEVAALRDGGASIKTNAGLAQLSDDFALDAALWVAAALPPALTQMIVAQAEDPQVKPFLQALSITETPAPIGLALAVGARDGGIALEVRVAFAKESHARDVQKVFAGLLTPLSPLAPLIPDEIKEQLKNVKGKLQGARFDLAYTLAGEELQQLQGLIAMFTAPPDFGEGDFSFEGEEGFSIEIDDSDFTIEGGDEEMELEGSDDSLEDLELPDLGDDVKSDAEDEGFDSDTGDDAGAGESGDEDLESIEDL